MRHYTKERVGAQLFCFSEQDRLPLEYARVDVSLTNPAMRIDVDDVSDASDDDMPTPKYNKYSPIDSHVGT